MDNDTERLIGLGYQRTTDDSCETIARYLQVTGRRHDKGNVSIERCIATKAQSISGMKGELLNFQSPFL